MIISVQTAPSVEPLSIADIKYQLRIEQDDNDNDITLFNLRKAARRWTENYLNRALITQTLDYYMQRFPSGDYYELPRPPIQSVTSLTYTDWNGDASTLTENTDFVLDSDSEPGRIVLEYNKTWPTDTLHPKNPIVTLYVAGYGDAASNVPDDIRQAMLMMVTHWYIHRQPIRVGAAPKYVDFTIESILSPYRILSV